MTVDKEAQMPDEYAYSLIVKAATEDQARAKVNEHLSIPAARSTSLGYDEVMLGVNADVDLSVKLNEWLIATRPHNGDPFETGSLIWWQGPDNA